MGPGTDHLDQDVKMPETKAKAGKERRGKRNGYAKGKTLHASRLDKMHPNVYFKFQFSPKARGLIFC